MPENNVDINRSIAQDSGTMTSYIPVLAIAACIAPAFAGEGWLTDLETGKKQAAAEHKAVLVEFTGSDWCPPCIALRKNVLMTPAFNEYATKNFVLVELDFPNSKPQPSEEKQKNDAWAKQYNVDGFPTILVMDPQGNTYGGFVGGRPDIDAVKQPLNAALQTMKTVKDNLAAAEKLTGDEKILALAKAYQSIPAEYRSSHASLLKQIMDLDKNDISGIVASEKKAVADKALSDKIQQALAACKTPQEAIAAAENLLAQKDLPKEIQMNLLQAKLKALLMVSKNDADFSKALAFLDEIAKVDTEHAQDIAKFKETLTKNKDAIIKRNTSQPGAPQQ